MDRRRFLGTLGAFGALGSFGPFAPGGVSGQAFGGTPGDALRRSGGPADRRLDAIGVQLYTVRHALQRDFEGTLARVAEIGYEEVEFAGYFGHPARQVRATLDRNGLRAPAAHVPYGALFERPDELLEAAITIGHRYLVVAWLDPADRATIEDWKSRAAEFDRFGARCRAAGLRFAYHNHDYEFVPIGGELPYDVLLAESDPELVQLELDVYWMTKAGADPVDYLRRHPGRYPLTHLKDSGGPPDHEMRDLGRGVIDFRRVIAAAETAGVRHHFMEHDDPADPFATIRAGYDYLSGLSR